ncbi:hypothetical protein AUEXF2481DRAFT_150974 [Aureobasidium subglaciale EXF-2481]|uniref:Uncharacterized protein n=1 Tax=Aureobasidium subglaciale (strain EXF-2481) TaxID=1043005 RepID=A0A074YSF3_AURSE|nr:uncharacterized protein AUEXF2481DRAFT_150974 [Aureobasidium subglaciale EXF-2481]KER00664.1 hypothetical protein AUEXF2481DRAFT_150974 [Aureobasidium subglaciale EXF-2481]
MPWAFGSQNFKWVSACLLSSQSLDSCIEMRSEMRSKIWGLLSLNLSTGHEDDVFGREKSLGADKRSQAITIRSKKLEHRLSAFFYSFQEKRI